MPCSDITPVETHGDFEHVSEHQTADTHQGHHHEDHEDTCSPFCICACCGINYDYQDIHLELPKIAFKFSSKAPSFTSNFYSNEFLFIWKPPKIA